MTRAHIKYQLDLALKKVEDTSTALIPFIEPFIRERSQASYKKNTIQNYRTTLWKLNEFRPEATFDDIDLTYFYKLLVFMSKKEMKVCYSKILLD